MKYDIWFEENLINIWVEGRASSTNYDKLVTGLLASPNWVPDANILIDYSELELRHLSSEEVQRLSSATERYRKKLGQGKCAIVNSKAVGFGVGRIWQTFVEDSTDLDINVFYSVDEAKQWLARP